MATTEGGEALFTETSDSNAEVFYTNFAKLADASDATRPALSDAYLAVLGMVKTSNKLIKAAAAKVRRFFPHRADAGCRELACTPPRDGDAASRHLCCC